jgi:VWFA-related protein
LTGDKRLYKQRAAGLFSAAVGAGTNTYGAVMTALNNVASLDPDQRNVMLLIGQATDCFNAYNIARMAAEHNTAIWVLDLAGRNTNELKPLAELSGGVYVRVESYYSLMERIKEFVGIWKNVYCLTYKPEKEYPAGMVPRREIHVDGVGEVKLIVSKGFRGPQVAVSFGNRSQPPAPSPPPVGGAGRVADLFPSLQKAGPDPDAFAWFVTRAIGLSTSLDEFFAFLEKLEPVADEKRRKAIGHLITFNVEVFARMNPSESEWRRLRARVGHVEDWKLMTGFFLPKSRDAAEFLEALDARSIPETPGYSAETIRAAVAALAFDGFQRFRELKPAAAEIEAYAALLEKRRRIPVLLALGARSFDRLALEMRSGLADASDVGQRLSFLEEILRSTTEAGQFWAVLKTYAAERPDDEFVAGRAVIHCLKTLAAFPHPETMIPEALKLARNTAEKLSVLRELNGSLDQINQLKDEAEDSAALVSIYVAAIAGARSADELVSALRGPDHPKFTEARGVGDHTIEAQLRQFGRIATKPEQYVTLSELTDSPDMKRKILSARLTLLRAPPAGANGTSAADRAKTEYAGRAAAAAAPSEPVTKLSTATVEIRLGASSDAGAPLAGLRKEDLLVEDEGRFYPAVKLERLSGPAHYTFVMDASESLQNQIREVRDAVMALAERLGPLDTFSVIWFDESCSLRIANTSDRAALREELARYQGKRRSLTSVEAGVKCAIQHAASIGQPRDQVVFLFSDGLSSRVEQDRTSLAALVEQSGVIVHCIQFGGHELAYASEVGFHRMKVLAEASGGRALAAERGIGISEIMRRLQPLVIDRYRLSYSPDPARWPGFHHVKVIDQSHPEYTFSFVPGYYSSPCAGNESTGCQAGSPNGDSGVQIFPPPGMRMAPITEPIYDDFDFSNPGGTFRRLIARVGPGGLFNFHPQSDPLKPGGQLSLVHLIQSRGIPNIRKDPEYTDYSRPFCLLEQDDSQPVQKQASPWDAPFLKDEPFVVELSSPEQDSRTWPDITLRTRFVRMSLVQRRDSTPLGRLVLTCHLPLEYVVRPGTPTATRWIRPSDDPLTKTSFTWRVISGILVKLFQFDVERFP